MLPRTAYLAAFCVGVMMSFALPERGSWFFWLILLILFGAGCFLLRSHSWGKKAACTFLWALLGTIYAIWRTQAALHQQIPLSTERAANEIVQIRVMGLPDSQANRTQFIAQATRSNGQSFRVLAQDYQARAWQVGDTWQVSAKLRAAIGTRNPVGFDREAWALANQVDGMATLGKERVLVAQSSLHINRLRQWIVQTWQQQAGSAFPQGTGLMTALAVGDRSGLSSQMWAALRPLGLNHLISISGLHIGMVALFAACLGKMVLSRLPFVPSRPRLWIWAIAWFAACGYTALAGWEIPALRSLIMLTVAALAWIMRGRLSSWQTWWAACTAVLLYQPTSVLAVGFWLSFGLVGVLLWVLACRLPAQTARTRWQHAAYIAQQAFIAQWAAALVGSLATLFLFGTFSPFAPLVNAIAIPVFSWLLVPLALIASALPLPFLQQFAAHISEYIAQYLLTFGTQLPEYHLPHPPVAVFCLAIIASLLLLLPRGTRLKPLAGCLLISYLAYTPTASTAPLRVHIWDVGQGLSILLQTQQHHFLFDTGNIATQTVSPNLHALGVRQLDALILSHHDNDHDGSYADIAQQFPIRTLWAGQPQHYPRAQHCTGGTHWQSDDVWFEFLTLPKQPAPQANDADNAQSCILRVIAGEHALLIMGDSGSAEEMQLVEQYADKLHSQVLILGHHGSKSASSSAFLRQVAPQIAIASSGLGNHFRHPHPDTQQRLQQQNIALLRTDTQGSLHLTLGGEHITQSPTTRAWWQRKPL